MPPTCTPAPRGTPRAAPATWTSSAWPSAPPTGAATTTSPNRSSTRWRWNLIRSRRGAGTGGTSATIGRYLRYRRLDTRLCVADPTGSAFVAGWRSRDRTVATSRVTLIEGIGRPLVEPGFVFEVVDAVEEVDDIESIAAAWLLEDLFGRRYGGSSGTNLVACLRLAGQMRQRGERGSSVSLLCDRGERDQHTLITPEWLRARGLDPARPCASGWPRRCADRGQRPPLYSSCTPSLRVSAANEVAR